MQQSRVLHSSWTGAVLSLAKVDLALLVCSFQHEHNGTGRVGEHVHHSMRCLFWLSPERPVIASRGLVQNTSRPSEVPVSTRRWCRDA